MARSLWSGSLSFGLVNVPVVMVTAVRDLDLHFRQLHEKDGAPIEVQRWCSKEDVEVSFDEIEHSFEFDDGSHQGLHASSAALRPGNLYSLSYRGRYPSGQ